MCCLIVVYDVQNFLYIFCLMVRRSIVLLLVVVANINKNVVPEGNPRWATGRGLMICSLQGGKQIEEEEGTV